MKNQICRLTDIECGGYPQARRLADTAWRATKAAEKSWSAAAKMREPDAWLRAIDGIDDISVRVQVACLVWWDHFSSRPANDAWHQLDGYLAAWTADLRADPKRVRVALIMIGYPTRLADWRVKNQKSETAVVRGARHVKR